MRKWYKLKPKQFIWLDTLMMLECVALLGFLVLYTMWEIPYLLWGIVIIPLVMLCNMLVYIKVRKVRKLSTLLEEFVKRNKLFQSHHFIVQTAFGEEKKEKMDYYPIIEYAENSSENVFYLKMRMDGSPYSEKLRELEQPLADMLKTICIGRIEERGYLTYCFELKPQQQVMIQSQEDIPKAEENEIIFTKEISWNWKACNHLLLVGNTGSGKTQLAQYIISCLIEQGVKIVYCDPKNDDDMRLFAQEHLSVRYITKENEIAKAIREAENEVRARERDLQEIGIKEADFNPIFVFFDEMIAFAKIADKKTYEETAKRMSAIVVAGRSKCVYAGVILQRPDTNFIEGAIRDNLGCRIAMGQMTEAAYKMVFGSDFSDVKNHRQEIGSGLIYRQRTDSVPREFLAPFICKGGLNRNV